MKNRLPFSFRRLLSSFFRFILLMTFFHFQGIAQDPDPLNHFVTTWLTTTTNTDITIPTHGTGYNYYVQWESGGSWEGPFTGDATHDYGAAESNTVRISGDFPRIYFNYAGDKNLIQSIDQWGDIAWTSMENAFLGCVNLGYTAADSPDLSAVLSMENMFRSCSAFNGNIGSWDVSNTINMAFMFFGCSAFNQDISTWNVSNVNNMKYMFYGASSFNSDLYWDVGNVTDMSFMFYGASSFNGIISGWNVHNVTNMSSMFHEASAFNQSIQFWDVGNVTDMSFMFYGASSFNGDISTWNVDSVTKMNAMFYGASSFQGGFLLWNVGSVIDMDSMFCEASSFNGYISSWNVANVTEMSFMFYGASSFSGGISSWNVVSVTTMSFMFYGASSFNGDISGWDVANVYRMHSMFYDATTFNQDISTWDVANVNTMENMFYNANSFNQNLGAWDISSVNWLHGMNGMLSNCGMNVENYDNTLIGWEDDNSGTQTIPSNITLGSNTLEYCTGYEARSNLINDYGWNIVGDAQYCIADATNFITTWETTTSNTDITIPTHGTGYNYYVQWESGGSWEGPFTGDATHDYGAAESNTVRISGDFPRIYFNNAGDKDLIQSIDQWGDIVWTSMENAFFGCGSLEYSATDNPDLSSATSMAGMFGSCSDFNGDISNWNVANITDMSRLFYLAPSFNQDISGWNVANVTNMFWMFYGASSFNQDLSGWNVANVTNMSSMFYFVQNFNQNISGWSVGNVTDMSFMFYGVTSFNQNISGWNVDNVTNMRAMFQSAHAFDQDISGWNVEGVTNMRNMFTNATAFNQDLGDWDISSISDMSNMLDNCGMNMTNYDNTLIGWADDNGGAETIPTSITLGANNLEYCNGFIARNNLVNDYSWNIMGDVINCSDDDTHFVTTWQTTSLNTDVTIPTTGTGYNYYVQWETGGNWEGPFTGDATHDYGAAETNTVRIFGDFPRIYFFSSGDKDLIHSIDQWGDITWSSMEGAFWNCTNLGYTATDVPDLSSSLSMKRMFGYCSNFNGAIGSWDVSNIENMSYLFDSAAAFNQDISGWSVNNVTDMTSMFRDAIVFNQDLSMWNVSNVTIMHTMFLGASSFNQDLSGWNVGNVTNMNSMFRDASSFNQNLSAWTVNSVTNMNSMFRNTSSFNQDISNWNVANVSDMSAMFESAIAFNQDISSWNVANVTNMQLMFRNADAFNQDISSWNVVNVTDMSSMFQGNSGFNQDLSLWNVGNVTNMFRMFEYATTFDQDLGNWDIGSVTNMTNMLDNCGMSIENYDNTLDGWADTNGGSQTIPSGITLGANNLEYCNGFIGHNKLQNVYNWTFVGDAINCDDDDTHFVTTWSNIPTSITIPTIGGNNYYVLWGDGSDWEGPFNGDASHSYGAGGGNREIRITGSFPRIYFNDSGDKNFILSIDQWGDISWTSMENAFYGCANLGYNATDNPDLSVVNSLESMFRDCTSFNGNIGTWDVSGITSMFWMFRDATSFNQDLSSWDVSSVQNMGGMFQDASAFNQSIFDLEVASVTNLGHMFNGASLFNQDISGWNVTNVSSMSYMFRDATSFNQDISGWSVANVTNMSSMFDMAIAFNQDLSGWNVGNVTLMSSMFRSASVFDQDISNWGVSNVTHMGGMFQGASSFNQDISDWDVSTVQNMHSMFFSASAFNQSLGNWDISSVSTMQFMLDNCGMSQVNYDNTLIGWADDNYGTETIPVGITLGANNLEYCNGFMARDFLVNDQSWTINGDAINCNMDTRNFVTTWETITDNTTVTIPTNGTGYEYYVMWSPGTSWEGPYAWDASHVYPSPDTYEIRITGDFPAIYFNNTGDKDLITSIDQWGDNVWSGMDNAFYGCNYLTYSATDIPDLSAVTDLSAMFRDCPAFNGNLSSWEVGSVTDMNHMFHNASVFNQNLSTWDVSQVSDFSYMFNKASAFDQNLGTWDISSATNMTSMLDNSNLSTTHYDNTLIGWVDDLGGTQIIPSGIALGSHNLEYCNALAERYSLIYDHSWTIDADALGCPCKWVLNTDDSGQGSLRFALGCSVPGNDLIRFSPALQNQVIELTSDPLAFAHDTELISSLGDNIAIDGSAIDHLFDIDLGRSVLIQGLSFNCGQSNSVSCFTNNGELELRDCHFTDAFSGTAAKGIQNNDNLTIEGEVKLLK